MPVYTTIKQKREFGTGYSAISTLKLDFSLVPDKDGEYKVRVTDSFDGTTVGGTTYLSIGQLQHLRDQLVAMSPIEPQSPVITTYKIEDTA